MTKKIEHNFYSMLRSALFVSTAFLLSIMCLLLNIIEMILYVFYPPIRKTKITFRLMKKIYFFTCQLLGIKIEIRGAENLQKHKNYILISKHMSIFEACILSCFRNTVTILRGTLMYIPFWNLILLYSSVIATNRRGGASALFQMLAEIRKRIKMGQSVLIFPEGTRRKFGASPKYHLGIMRLYPEVTFLPVALNTGVFFGKCLSSYKKSGTIIIDIMPAIPSNMSHSDVKKYVVETIEQRTNELVALDPESLKNNPNVD